MPALRAGKAAALQGKEQDQQEGPSRSDSCRHGSEAAVGLPYELAHARECKSQLVPILKAGLTHRGFALVDVISPCVTFNDHEGSTKSYRYTRQHQEPIITADFVPPAGWVSPGGAPRPRVIKGPAEK